jgi:hypothetical protein
MVTQYNGPSLHPAATPIPTPAGQCSAGFYGHHNDKTVTLMMVPNLQELPHLAEAPVLFIAASNYCERLTPLLLFPMGMQVDKTIQTPTVPNM